MLIQNHQNATRMVAQSTSSGDVFVFDDDQDLLDVSPGVDIAQAGLVPAYSVT